MSRSGDPSKRPSFDPRRAKGAPREQGLFKLAGDPAILTVSQLTRMVKGAINTALPDTLHVVGELSNVSQPAGGHVYFTLKDAASELRCVMWKSAATGLKFTLADGLEVVATGSVDVYEPRGQYQFYARRLEPRGVGALELAFQQLKEKLAKEGLFDAKRKRRLPPFPQRIAIVTSTTGAAVRDILQTIRRRYPVVEVFVFGVRVQGEGAADEIADAIRRINAANEKLGGVDVMIVGRGGGSLEDLWAFNEEAVARAISKSEIPIVSAVGHEVDFTIADFVADVRAATPTAAAELVVPVLTDVLDMLDGQSSHLRRALGRTLDRARARLAVGEKSEWFRDPVGCVRRRWQQIDEVAGRLRLAAHQALASRRDALHALEMRHFRVRPEAILAHRRERLGKIEARLRWTQNQFIRAFDRRLRETESRFRGVSPLGLAQREHLLLTQLSVRLLRATARRRLDAARTIESFEARLDAASHESVLKRGFSITRRMRGKKVVRGPSDVREGDKLETQTGQGTIASRVVDADQGDLFE